MLNRTEKIAIIKKAIKLISSRERYFMCTAIEFAAATLYGMDIRAVEEIPELLKYKPEHVSKGTAWFYVDEQEIRISILKKVLKDIDK